MAKLLCLCLVIGLSNLVGSEWTYEGHTITLAHLNISYNDPVSGASRIEVGEVGKFGVGAVGSASGIILIGESYDENGLKDRRGCRKVWDVNPPPDEPWIALVAKGGCSDTEKVQNAKNHNASAVLVYAHDAHAHLQKLALSKFRFGEPVYGDGGAVVVFLGHLQGEQLARLVENGTKVAVTITRGQDVKFRFNNINRTSVLFVSVSFIILMVISLAWLIFYYIQRFRYIHAKDKLARHLCNAAKKALSKIPVKQIKHGDKEIINDNECCAVCIESYQVSESLRVLPCKHQFHKICVDPWLLEHRTCPMCKMDILKYYGFVLSGSEESIVQMEVTEDAPAREVEAIPAAPTSSSNNDIIISNTYDVTTTANTSIEDMVLPAEAFGNAEAVVSSCEGWTDSPVPDTPISPVHQAIVNPPSTTASASVLSSMIDSARALASQAGRVSMSSHVSSTVAPVKLNKCRTPLPPIKDVCVEKGTSGAITSVSGAHEDLEVASVCSQDFSDTISMRSDVDAAIQEVLRTTEELDKLLASKDAKDNIENIPSNIVNYEGDSPFTSEGSDSATICSPLRKCTDGSARVSRSSARRSSSTSHSKHSGSKSHSRRRSASRSRSRRRSSSQGRSSSRGRSSGTSGTSSQLQSTPRAESRPSSHVVSVSHY